MKNIVIFEKKNYAVWRLYIENRFIITSIERYLFEYGIKNGCKIFYWYNTLFVLFYSYRMSCNVFEHSCYKLQNGEDCWTEIRIKYSL